MPRLPRLQFEGAFYHVFHRGNRKERIFLDDPDYFRFETMLLEAMRTSGVSLYGWKQMPNHFHLLLGTPQGNLADFMHRLLTRYAKYFNWRHKLVGHVFQGRYGARLCDKEAYFRELIRYIQLNAYRTHPRPLADIGSWKWSSHRYLMLPESQWPEGLRNSFRELLERFGSETQVARRAYAKFLADGLEKGNWESFYQVKNQRYVGDPSFVEKIKKRLDEPVRQHVRTLKRLKTAEELADHVVQVSGISRPTLSDKTQQRFISRWRRAFVYVGRTRYRFSMGALARVLDRDISAASQILRRLRRRSLIDEISLLLSALDVGV